MKRTPHSLTLVGILLCLLITACQSTPQTAQSNTSATDTDTLAYATLLRLAHCEGYTQVTIRNPWNTDGVLGTYILVDRQAPLPDPMPEGTLVRTPLTNALVYSTVHCGLFCQIGAVEQIGGVCDIEYINLPAVQSRYAEGAITHCGSSMEPNVEQIIDLHPDAILLSPFENNGGYGRIEQLEIPIIECADYMETSPLARAEWMKFFGLLLGRTEQTDSLFAEVTTTYKAIKAATDTCSHHPTVLSDLRSSGMWYVPGGASTTAIFYRDAGFRYIFSADEHAGSVPMALETVLEEGASADFWLIRYYQTSTKSYTELANEYAPYAHLQAFSNRNVWGCNTAQQPFYEDVAFNPHLILADLANIAHPELKLKPKKRYFSKLKEK